MAELGRPRAGACRRVRELPRANEVADELAPGALQRLVGLPLLDARDVVAGEGLRVLARIALDPGEDQTVRLAARVLLTLDQHFTGDGSAGLGVAVVLDHRR